MLHDYDLLHGLEFDCHLQALLDRNAKPFIDFNAFRHYMQFIDMYMFRFRYGIQKVFAEVSSTPPEPGHVGGDLSGCLLGLHTQTIDSLSALYRIPV